jgi:cysteine desulfurase
MKLPIYLDNHSTTPVDPRVVEAMLPTFCVNFGNPSSANHAFGWEAEELVKVARERVAGLINAEPEEIIFTSGATESNNLAIKGVAMSRRRKGNHLITVATEHKAVLYPMKRLEEQGLLVTVLPVGPDGLLDLARLERAITPATILISVMQANNEIGVLQPIREIGALAHERGIFFHTDAVQAVGKIPVDVTADHIDLLSLSGHKMYGPKGVGALHVRRRGPRVNLSPLFEGSGHERGVRPGTLNVPGIVGLGRACEIAKTEMADEAARTRTLRDRLLERLRRDLDGVNVNGSLEHRLPNNLNVAFEHVEGEALIAALTDIAVSTGSACLSAEAEPSHVIRALGREDQLARASIRFGLGRFNTVEEIDHAAVQVVGAVRRLREASPLVQMARDGSDPHAVQWREH